MRKQLPKFSEVLSVYSVVMVMAYGWTIIVFMWKTPTWILFLNFGEILSLFSYAIVSALVESLVILGAVVIVTFLVPRKWFSGGFIVCGTWFVLGGYGMVMIYHLLHANKNLNVESYLHWWSIAALGMAFLLSLISGRVKWMRAVALWISDRLQVFLLILMPLSVISILAIALRNLW